MTQPHTQNVAEIAAGLSDAQKDALFGRYSWSSPWDQETGEAELYRLGIWGPHGGRSERARAVRAYLLSQSDGGERG